MTGKLSSDIINAFRKKFETNCIELVLKSYIDALSCGRRFNESSENDITVQLVGFMQSNQDRKNLEISITRESYYDTEETYSGKISANVSARIDIKFHTWGSKEEYEYFMEAKNLSEENWVKNSTSTGVNAMKQIKRYIDPGISNFLTSKYPQGCLLGFIQQGKAERIVDTINRLLISTQRQNEILIQSLEYNCAFHYVSKHSKQSIDLKHFFLNFAN